MFRHFNSTKRERMSENQTEKSKYITEDASKTVPGGHNRD